MSDVAGAAPAASAEGEVFAPERLKQLYRALLLPRLIEDKALLLLRQGKLSKWFSGMGQEAIAVGVAAALDPDDWILPMHRNLGVFTKTTTKTNKHGETKTKTEVHHKKY